MRIQLEQFNQARRIHGGLFGMWTAALGVRLSRCPVPGPMRTHIYRRVYGGKYDSLNESELEKPLSEYRSINELFTRGVPPDQRPLAKNIESTFTVPCDCTVQTMGSIGQDTTLTVKQTDYRLETLAPQTDVACFRNGRFAILFLSPRDCHRVFSPQSGTLDAVTHVPGSRFPVHPPFQRPEFPVFTLNERLVMELTTPLGRCMVIMVAGWGVGHITHPFELPLRPHRRKVQRLQLTDPRKVSANEWLATFELGSTVVFVTEGTRTFDTQLAAGDSLHFGQSLFSEVTHTAESLRS
ncbi:MAG: archaetidylserine decarboxylase [Fuerstiella sp.]